MRRSQRQKRKAVANLATGHVRNTADGYTSPEQAAGVPWVPARHCKAMSEYFIFTARRK